jgi:replicative DNA helicase
MSNFDNRPALSNLPNRIAPKVEELEMDVLGALILESDALTSVIDILKPSSFYKKAHQEIYKAVVDLFNNSQSIDFQTVTNQLRKNGSLETVGGMPYITYLTNGVSSAVNIEVHARIIVEYAIRRELISVATEIQNNAYEETIDVLSLLDKSEQILFEVGESNIRKNYSDISSLMAQAFKELHAKKELKDGLIGIPSGFIDLDKITLGWQRSELIIVAARPGMGKTAFLLSALRNAAVDHNYPVAIFSLEMSGLQLVNRMLSIDSELESEKIKKGKLEEYEWEQLIHKTTNLANAPIYIDDTPALSVFELRAKCRRLKAKYDIQLVAVDYLQLMSSSSNRYGMGNREQEIASISRALKSLAKELNIAVIAASQLSRAVETRGGDKRPMLSDLRESGSIEQDADMVMFLYRPEYYSITEDAEGNSTTGTSEVIVAKHRNGALGTTILRYIGKYVKFENLHSQGFKYSKSGDMVFKSGEPL